MTSCGRVSVDTVLDIIQIEEDSKQNHKVIDTVFRTFVRTADQEQLERLLMYCTGCRFVPMRPIKVKYEGDEGFFVSICLFCLTIPTVYTSQEEFNTSFNSIITPSGKAFSSV